MNENEKIANIAKKNYENSSPWPEKNAWHNHTFTSIKTTVELWLSQLATDGMKILNAGSGGTVYENCKKMIHLDITEKYICRFDEYLVGSIENIKLPDESVDGIVCVGSVLNYSDSQRAISEFFRILKKGGFLILEFERSESAEFLWTADYKKYIFSKKYQYNNQMHLLWMYSENHIRHLLHQNHLIVHKSRRIHSLSSLMYRLGVSEEKAALFGRFDSFLKILTYPLAHNVILLSTKDFFPE